MKDSNIYQGARAFEELNPQRQQFVLELIKHKFNATKAAIEAGYSEKSARSQASQLLTNLNIQEAIAEQVEELQQRTKVDADYMLNILKEDVEADIADLYDEQGNLQPIKDWPLVFRRGLVASLKIETVRTRGDDEESEVVQVKEVKLADRTKLKELLGRHKAVRAFEKEHENSEIHIHIGGKDSAL
ncbi:MAG: terminase small subunit [Candidatus Thiodiazotropha sp. (ex Troendleina suluensis)]|nr:terminase small subunit [Candidatus Thiodiazotropha sp. (ex Troendleina suluensis)]